MYEALADVGGDVDTVQMYLENGTPMGGFYTALFENNLARAVITADSHNKHKLIAITQWLLWYAPTACYGSPEKVHNWMYKGGYKQWNTLIKSLVDSKEVSA